MSSWPSTLDVCLHEVVSVEALRFNQQLPHSKPRCTNLNGFLASSGGPPLPMSSKSSDEYPPASLTNVPAGRRVPTSEEWDFHKSAIIQSYLEKDHSLKQVMDTMRAQHDFHATVKMYKSRLIKWDVRKYTTWTERETICRMMKQKQGDGKTSGHIIVRGKPRPVALFLRHMKQSRANIRPQKVLVRSKHLEDVYTDAVKRDQEHSQIPPSMYAGGPQRTVEIVCKEISSLFVTAISGPVPSCIPSDEMCQLLGLSADRFDKNRPAEVRVILNRTATWFVSLIVSQPATALLALLKCQSIRVTSKFYSSDFLGCFNRHLRDFTRERYGPRHSITSLLMHILHLQRDFDEMRRLWQSFLRVTISNLNGGESTISRGNRTITESFTDAGQHRKAGDWPLDALNPSHSEPILNDTKKVTYYFILGWYYAAYQQARHDEAEQIFRAILTTGTHGGEVRPYHVHLAYLGLGRLAEARGDREAAVDFHCRQMKAAWDVWGRESAMGQNAASILARYLWKIGREKEAGEAESLIKLTDELSGTNLDVMCCA